MNRSDRRAIARFPVTLGPWEVVFLPAGVELGDSTVLGLLLVAEQGTGNVRHAGPLLAGNLGADVRSACAPPGARPSRPSRILCSSASFVGQLRSALEGTGITVDLVREVPAADAALDALIQHMTAGSTPPYSAPGIDTDLPAWGATLRALWTLAPWIDLEDQVELRFGAEVPELAGAVAIILGFAGEQDGIALYWTDRDYERFLAAAEAGRDIPADISYMLLSIDPAEEYLPTERRSCAESGLELPEGRLPLLMSCRDGVHGSPTARDQRVFLAALQAILVLCGPDPSLLGFGKHTTLAPTHLGPVTVRSLADEHALPPGPVPLLVDVHHNIWLHEGTRHPFWGDLPMLCIQGYKPDALRIAAMLAGIHAVRVDTTRTPAVLWVVQGNGAAPLTYLPADVAARLPALEEVTLTVASGGIKRGALAPASRVAAIPVRVEVFSG